MRIAHLPALTATPQRLGAQAPGPSSQPAAPLETVDLWASADS